MLTGGDIGIRACMHHSVLLGATADNTVGGRVTALVSPRGGPRYSIGRPPCLPTKEQPQKAPPRCKPEKGASCYCSVHFNDNVGVNVQIWIHIMFLTEHSSSVGRRQGASLCPRLTPRAPTSRRPSLSRPEGLQRRGAVATANAADKNSTDTKTQHADRRPRMSTSK